jgi:hypothetical protein
MGPKQRDPWPFTRVPEWYKTAEAKEMQVWECMRATSDKIHADCSVGLDTVCLLYNWVDDGMLPMSWLEETYPKVHAQVLEWQDLARKESQAKDAFRRELPEAYAEAQMPRHKRANTGKSSKEGPSPHSATATGSATDPRPNNARATGTLTEQFQHSHGNPM